MRITTVTGKIIYIIGVFGLILVLNVFFIYRFVNPTVDVLIVAVLNVAYVIVGVRTFRGAGENRDDPRPWWRATEASGCISSPISPARWSCTGA